jgi:hypothetical protein
MTGSTAGAEENAQVVGGPFRIGLAAVRTLVVSCRIQPVNNMTIYISAPIRIRQFIATPAEI